jgi:hypothetical protein
MPSLLSPLQDLVDQVASKKANLEDALFKLQTWIDQNAPALTEADRQEFATVLRAEKAEEPADANAQKSSDRSLIASVLRLHAMRLLFRLDASREVTPLPAPEDDTIYAQKKHRLKLALQEVETAVNEARIDTAIANAHGLLGDTGANRRWLHDALIRIQTVAAKDLNRMAETIPTPPLPSLNLLQRIMFRVYGIKQEEIARRTLTSLRQIAALQTSQIAEMATLLADSFNAVGDKLGAQQALAILTRLEMTPQGNS